MYGLDGRSGISAGHLLQQHPQPQEPQHEEDVELLLENYLSLVRSLARRSEGLSWKLTSTTKIIEIELAAARNRLLRYDVGLEIVSVITAVAALVAGLFGMNLQSGLESDGSAFWTVFAVAAGGVVVLPVALGAYIKSRLGKMIF